MWEIARDSGTLDLNSPYFYLTLGGEFSETCIVAKSGNAVVGFVVGFRPPRAPDTMFVWQIAVAHSHRRKGIAQEMLRSLMLRLSDDGVNRLEATVTPSNAASGRMFRSFAEEYGATCEESPFYEQELFPGQEHEEERLLSMGPFDAQLLRSQRKEAVAQDST